MARGLRARKGNIMATIPIRKYEITLTGKTPLLMHQDSIEWADRMDQWKLDPKNKKFSKAGDDRSPAFRWIGFLYHDGTTVALPQDNLMRCIMEGGALVMVPGGRSGKTFKAQTQSGMMCETPFLPFYAKGKQIRMESIHPLIHETEFSAHETVAESLGFLLWAKRARIGAAKHIRIRPRFDDWSVVGNLVVFDKQITADVLMDILESAGRLKGLCDWRPSSRTPGPFGTFDASIREIKG